MTVDYHDFVWVFHMGLMDELDQMIPHFSMFWYKRYLENLPRRQNKFNEMKNIVKSVEIEFKNNSE